MIETIEKIATKLKAKYTSMHFTSKTGIWDFKINCHYIYG